jgi:hypothetical protein
MIEKELKKFKKQKIYKKIKKRKKFFFFNFKLLRLVIQLFSQLRDYCFSLF